MRFAAIFAVLLCASAAMPQTASARFAKASERLQAGDLPAAESELNAAIGSGATDPRVYNLLGLICSRTNRLEKAIGYYQQALKVDPGFEPARNGLGAAYIRHGDFEQAFRLFKTSLNASPNDVTAHFNLGVILAQQDNYADAIEHLETANRLAPHDPVILMWLARVELAAGHAHESVAALDAALTSMAQNSHGRANAGLIADALELSSRLGATNSGSQATFLLARAQFLAGDYDAALGNLDQIPKSERRAEYYNLLGMCYAGISKFPEAIAALTKGIEIEPARTDLLFSLGSVYQASGNNEEAIRIFRRAIAAGDHSPELHFALALSYFNFGSYENAVRSCNLAIQSNADFDQAYLLLGRAYARTARPLQAIAAMKKAISINPACEQCEVQLALVLLDTGGDTEAEKLLHEAVRLSPADASAHYELGKALAKHKQNSEAIAELRKTIELDPRHDRAYYQLGRLYLALGDRANAQVCLEAVRDLKEKRRADSEGRLGRTK